MASLKSLILAVSAASLVAACATPSGPPPLRPVPTQPVQSTGLLPPPGATVDQAQTAAAETAEQQVAGLTPQPQASVPQVAGPPAREEVLGQWRVSSGGSTCDMFVTLTGWQGGYRASTRGCGNPTLGQIGAWNIEGNNVVLKDAAGNPLATLAGSAATGFSGATSTGGGISMVR